jgi:catechol 2,3-dioxygenase-like lactoylglutathione lyase family enzyme
MASPVNVTGVDFLPVFVTDYPRALEFYCGLLGLAHTVDYGKIPAGEVEAGNLTLQIADAASVGQEFQPSKSPLALHVDDVEAARAKLEAKGIEFTDFIDSGVCHMAFFSDPDGNALMLHHRYAPQPEPRVTD